MGTVLFAIACGFFLARAPVEAASHLTGLVLSVDRNRGEVVVRHEPFDGMPGMTMTFHVALRSELEKIAVGNGIDADVDRSSDPWTLRAVHIAGQQSVTGETQFRSAKRLRLGDAVPDVLFTTQAGRQFTFAQMRGDFVVMAFIYTRCQDARMCPLISSKFGALQRILDPRTRLVEVTLDPDFDRPDVLRAYAAKFGADPARWTMLTGDPNTVLDFAAQFGLSAFADPTVGIIHNENTVIVDPSGRIDSMVTENSWQPEEIAAEIDHAKHRASNPIARFDLWLSRTAVAVCGDSVAGFSGLTDLLVAVLITGAGGWLLIRVYRGIAREQ